MFFSKKKKKIDSSSINSIVTRLDQMSQFDFFLLLLRYLLLCNKWIYYLILLFVDLTVLKFFVISCSKTIETT